jgi:type VI secretion system secreted protein Hcp
MALNAYLRMRGQKSGEIKGSVTQKGRENKIMVIASEHSIVSPRDPASGLPTGKRMHKPFVITKQVDQSSPLLYNLMATNENIVDWELQFWRPSPTGIEEQYYTVKLTNANISSINFHQLNTQDPSLIKFAEHEEVAFTYQRIQWIWTSGGITSQDDWMAPVV